MGRVFSPEEDEPSAPPVALVSHAFWQERFGAGPEILGQTIRLNDSLFTIIGVLPRGFEFRVMGFLGSPGEKPIWIPVGADGYARREGAHGYEAIGRLAPGATLEQATLEAQILIPAADEEPGHSVRLVSRQELETEGFQAPLFLLLGAAVILLLIACGNVATLLMAEFTGRRHEMATRSALGAGGRRLIRQLLTESLILGLAGGTLGTLLAFAGTRGLLGLARGRFGEILGSGWRSGSRGGSGFQRTVISLELALTLVLLVSGALLARSLGALMRVETGFTQDQLVMARTFLPSYRYGDSSDRSIQVERMQQALCGIPGVLATSGTSSLPFFNAPNALSYGIEGEPEVEALSPQASERRALPGFFETMGIRTLEGREILDTDRLNGPAVAVISETMARRHWPERSPLGARILFGDTLEVVGVAADVLHKSLDAMPLATMYVPFLTDAGTSMNFLVRADAEPEILFPNLRQAIWSVDPSAPISRVATVPYLILDSARDERFRAVLMVVFAVCAALLAGAGVFGVTSRAVSQRTKEMGIRKALGADPRGLVRLVLAGTVRAGSVGVGLGLLGAFWTSRLLAQFLLGVEPWDPLTYGAVALTLFALTLAASYFPARRAGVVAPMDVLREE